MLGSTLAGLAGALVMLEALSVEVVRTCAPASAEDPVVIFVDADAPPGGDGASWLTAFADLQDALEAAVVQAPPIQLWLAEGDYLPTLRLDPDESRSATFVLFDGLEILGGFAGDESSADERDPGLHVSRLLGDLLGDDAYGHHCPGGTTFTGVDENVFHVMRFETAGAVILDGLTVTGGNAVCICCPLPDLNELPGGGLLIETGTVEVRACVFRGNQAERGGGAISVRDGGAVIATASSFELNAAEGICVEDHGRGGAVLVEGSSFEAFACVFRDNAAQSIEYDGAAGGAVAGMISADLLFEDCVFETNVGTPYIQGAGGGGVAIYDGTLTARRCEFLGNCGDQSGQGIRAASSTTLVEDSRFESNGGSDDSFGGAMYVAGGDDIPGTPDDDLRLGPVSPCTDAGDNDAVPPGVSYDLAGNPRFIDDPAVPDSGHGAPPIVDIGAYERVPGDVDGDGVVGVVDLLAVIASWGACGTPCPADLNGDGSVGYDDLLMVIGSWS